MQGTTINFAKFLAGLARRGCSRAMAQIAAWRRVAVVCSAALKAIAAPAADAAVSAGPSSRAKARARRLRRGAAAFAAVCTLTGTTALTLAGTASADTYQPAITVQNTVTGQCLQDNGGPVTTAPCNESAAQTWDITVGSYGFIWTNAATGWCLQNDGYGYGYGNLYTQPCTGALDQGWFETSSSPLPEHLQEVSRLSGLCLESDQYGNAYVQSCDPSHWQYWGRGPTSLYPSY